MQQRPTPGARWALGAARALVWSIVFLVSSALGVILHADLPPMRATLGVALNRSLDGNFRGQIRLGHIEHLGARSVTVRTIDVFDEHGRLVLALEGVKLGYRPLLLLESLLGANSEPLTVDHLRVDRSRIVLVTDPENGEWTLATAFSKRAAAPSPRRPKRPLVYSLPAVELGEVAILVEHPALGKLEANIHRVQGNAELGGEDTAIAVQRFGVRLVLGEGLALDGTGSLRLLRNGFVAGAFHGFVDGVEVDAAAQLDAGTLAVRLDVPEARPEQMREVLPEWPLSVPLTAHVTAGGPLEALVLGGVLRARDSSIELGGHLDVKRFPAAQLTLSGHALDARLFWPEAPAMSLEARAKVLVSGSTSAPVFRVEAETEPVTVAGTELPAAKVSLEIDETSTRGDVRLGDARASVEAHAALMAGNAVEVTLHARQLDLLAWPELQGQARGRGEVEALFRVAQGRLSGNVVGRFDGLASGPVTVGRSRIESTFDGPLAELARTELRTSLAGSNVAVGPLKLQSVTATGRGTWKKTRFHADVNASTGARGTLDGNLELGSGVEVRELDVTWTEPAFSLGAHASVWSPNRGALALDMFRLSGSVGSLSGSLHVAGERLSTTANAERLDTRLLARSFGISGDRFSGFVTGHGELHVEPGSTRGALKLEAQRFAVGDLTVAAVNVGATLDGTELRAQVKALDPALGTLDADATARLAGSAIERSAWLGATGSASAKLENLPLWPVGLMISESTRVKDLDGRLDVALQLERQAPDAAPSVFVQANTRELTFSMAPSEGATEPLVYERFALHGSASIDGPSGHGAATVLLTDEHGALVTTSGSLALDVGSLIADPRAMLQRLFQTPLDGLVRLHPRPLSLLPPPFGFSALAGSVQGTLQLRGSLSEPTVTLAVQGHQVLGSFADSQRAVDISGLGHYTPNTGQLTAQAEIVHAGQRLVSARLEGNVPIPLGPTSPPREVELRAAAMFNGLPLELWPAAARERIEARLYGSFDIEKQGPTLRQRAQLEIGNLSVKGQALGNGRLTFESEPAGARAELRIGSRSRYVAASLRGLTPASEEADLSIEGTLVARGFTAASLSPFTSGVLTRLGGDMDADLDFSFRPADGYLGIDGQATLTQGNAHLDLLGLEVRELAAVVTARSTPEYTVLLIDPIDGKARARNSSLQGNAELWLEGLRVVNGEANLALNEVPLSLKGALRGVARGQIRGRLERMPDHMLLEVKVPNLRIGLPASSTRSLISLDPNPDLNVLQVTERAAPRPKDALLWKIAFELGDSVRIQRADLDVPLTGQPRLEYQHEVRPSGSIEALPGGHLMLFDQTFTIDRALVQFIPAEPDNPRVDLTASWRAPDGTTIYVDITGSASDATVLTRDDRGLQEVERFYLITGTPGGTGRSVTTTGSADGSPADEAALGQTFALGINELLRESLGNVAVSVGTTSDDRASYSASVRLSDKVSFQGNFQPASDTNLEQSTNDLTGTLDYRFSRNWSLRTELGTSGGAFDLLWSYRY